MAVLLETVDFGYIRLRKVAGTMNPTNSLTKHTTFREHSRDMAYFMNRLSDEYPDGPRADTVEVTEALLNMREYVAKHSN
jgi:hypothetical protein